MPTAAPETAELAFHAWRDMRNVDDPLRKDISCIAVHGEAVFVACDETASIERLRRGEGGGYADHAHFDLGDIFDLPDGLDGEMDIEGLAAHDGYLWIVGSHSLKRDTPDAGQGPAAALEEMTDIDRDPNRYFLGCVPITDDGDGEGPVLVKRDGDRRAACLKLKKSKSRLFKWLDGDAHLDPFLTIPSKENGFDIEGLAAKGSRVWLGLRGPVLRGHGVILELDMKRPKPSRLKARKAEDGRRYRKYLLDTDGLGVRDLCVDGTDLLVLAGTPLAGDGPARVLRWKNALADTQSGVVDPSRIETALELPYKGPVDHPEGIDLIDAPEGRRLIVVHDSPAPDRVAKDPARLTADLYPF